MQLSLILYFAIVGGALGAVSFIVLSALFYPVIKKCLCSWRIRRLNKELDEWLEKIEASERLLSHQNIENFETLRCAIRDAMPSCLEVANNMQRLRNELKRKEENPGYSDAL